jgi:hypothetical protein
MLLVFFTNKFNMKGNKKRKTDTDLQRVIGAQSHKWKSTGMQKGIKNLCTYELVAFAPQHLVFVVFQQEADY